MIKNPNKGYLGGHGGRGSAGEQGKERDEWRSQSNYSLM